MRYRFLAFLSALAAVIAVVVLAPVLVVGQAPKAAATTKAAAATWTPPRTPWGDPDFQGIYTNKDAYFTPFERPREFGERQFLTDEEFAMRVEEAKKMAQDDPAERGNSERDTLRAPLFWHERGIPNRQTSFVVDPPDGRIPPLTSEAQKREAASAAAGRGRGEATDSWEERSLWERCLTRGLPGSMLAGQYGSAYQIMQTPGYVTIRTEMVHETRIIPVDGRPHVGPRIRSYMGDSRGHWEGNALIVETTNFSEKAQYRGSLGSYNVAKYPSSTMENLRLIERFTPLAADTINWEVTLDDPTTWTRPWTFRVLLTGRDDREEERELRGGQAASKREVEQYDCHEGNYGLINLLRSARSLEKQKAAEEIATKKER